MYPIALNNSVHSSLIEAEFPTRIKGVQKVFFPRVFKIILHDRSVRSCSLRISLRSVLFLCF